MIQRDTFSLRENFPMNARRLSVGALLREFILWGGLIAFCGAAVLPPPVALADSSPRWTAPSLAAKLWCDRPAEQGAMRSMGERRFVGLDSLPTIARLCRRWFVAAGSRDRRAAWAVFQVARPPWDSAADLAQPSECLPSPPLILSQGIAPARDARGLLRVKSCRNIQGRTRVCRPLSLSPTGPRHPPPPSPFPPA